MYGKPFRLPSAFVLGVCTAPDKHILGYQTILYACLPRSVEWKAELVSNEPVTENIIPSVSAELTRPVSSHCLVHLYRS